MSNSHNRTSIPFRTVLLLKMVDEEKLQSLIDKIKNELTKQAELKSTSVSTSIEVNDKWETNSPYVLLLRDWAEQEDLEIAEDRMYLSMDRGKWTHTVRVWVN